MARLPIISADTRACIGVGYAFVPGVGYRIEARYLHSRDALPVHHKHNGIPSHYALVLDCDRPSIAPSPSVARATIREAIANMRALNWRVEDIGDMGSPDNRIAWRYLHVR